MTLNISTEVIEKKDELVLTSVYRTINFSHTDGRSFNSIHLFDKSE